MANLVPAITFILAVSFRGKAKLAGTLVGIGGAMLLTFYKGSVLDTWSTHVDLLHSPPPPHSGHVAADHQNRGLGALFAVGSCCSYALWLIVQAKMGERYPCPYSATALMCIMGSIQAVVYALCTERDWTQWKLGNCGVGADGDDHSVVREEARTSLRLHFQPADAGLRRRRVQLAAQREASPGKRAGSDVDHLRAVLGDMGEGQRDGAADHIGEGADE
ncbi:unnamed protein product [Linum tenue]|uniref:WAT1-related protein n=1 Tax=Linum tenue TaxID=586396 RepID=A0AAV0GRT5_9ROSI|nr:unnamed protein product [Linum tenue]